MILVLQTMSWMNLTSDAYAKWIHSLIEISAWLCQTRTNSLSHVKLANQVTSLLFEPDGNSVKISFGASGDTKCPCSALFTQPLPMPEEKHLVLFFPLLLNWKFGPVLMSIRAATAIVNCFCLNLNQRMIIGHVILCQAEMIQIGASQDGSLRFQT